MTGVCTEDLFQMVIVRDSVAPEGLGFGSRCILAILAIEVLVAFHLINLKLQIG